MPYMPIRRSQLVAPFGVGALHVTPSGISLITAGLDHWYDNSDGSDLDDKWEFVCKEWRLEKALGVSEFRVPPDYRASRGVQGELNRRIQVPALRFPTTHFCSFCHTLEEQNLTVRERTIFCKACQSVNRRNKLFQVQIVTMCQDGHIGEFPWREWAHKSTSPSCTEPMKLRSGTGGQQGDQIIRCGCGESRTLGNVWLEEEDGSTRLSNDLLDENQGTFLCKGTRPWIGDLTGTGCDQHIRAAFRSDSNLYFPKVASSVYIPRSTVDVPSELLDTLDLPHFSVIITLSKELLNSGKLTEIEIAEKLKQANNPQLIDFTDAQIVGAIKYLAAEESQDHEENINEDEDSFRHEEYKVLREVRDEHELKIVRPNIDDYEEPLNKCFDRITLIHKLRETRVLTGFGRVNPPGADDPRSSQDFMFKNPPVGNDRWLPASIVYGEGIYLELSEHMIETWETHSKVTQRIQPLLHHYQSVNAQKFLSGINLSPRFLLVHTFSHLLINQLVFECGYSSSSLRERLYISETPGKEMASLLIYTASGDSDGTMGGLVRMGKPGNLEGVINTAIQNAKWCSADPVCTELAQQGPDGCNLSACHSCALVPETSCEQFNRFLDRSMVVSGLLNKGRGYFS